MNNIVLLFFLMMLAVFTKSQTLIQGQVIDEVKQPIIWVEIFELNQQNEIVQTVQTDESGKFEIEVKNNLNRLSFESLGYETSIYFIENLNSKELNFIQLKVEKQVQLSEAIIVNRKKAITMKGDKIILDVESLGIGSGNNGLETMQQIPGITLDKDENIQFRGSSGVQIMINGKKSMLQGDALREFIRNLRGEDIKTVEIISQPSARYEASGTTGIINIVLKRNTQKLLGGNLNSSASYGEYFKHRIGGRLFYNDSLWSIYTSGSYYEGKSFNDRQVNQMITLDNGVKNINQSNYWLPETISKSVNLGVERKLSKFQTISTEWQFYHEKENALTTGLTTDFFNDEWMEEVKLTKKTKTPVQQILGNLYYQIQSENEKSNLEAQFNYGNYQSQTSGTQINEFSNQDIAQLDGFLKTNYDMWNIQLDWKQKLNENFNFELGSKFSNVEMDYYNEYIPILGNMDLIPDSLLINDFKYKEKLLSAYTQLNYSKNNWNFLVGMRMEHTDYVANSYLNSATNKDQYTNWFPSASVVYAKENHQYRASYSRRISRPSYLSLNPYFSYLDAYSIQRGNPDLKPQFFDSFELNYIYKNAMSFGFYGYLYKDGFVNVIDYNPDKNYNQIYQGNAAKGYRFGFSASIPYRVGNWWTMQLGIDSYLVQEKSDIENYQYDGKGYGYEFSMYHRFDLPRKWTIIWNGFYNGRSETVNGISPVVYDFSFSVKKTILDDRLQLVAGCNNFLKRSMYKLNSTVGNVSTNWTNEWETRRFYVQLTYNFGLNREKRVKSTSLNDEQNRMN